MGYLGKNNKRQKLAEIMTNEHHGGSTLRLVGGRRPAAAVRVGDLEVVAFGVELASAGRSAVAGGVDTDVAHARRVVTGSDSVGTGLLAGLCATDTSEKAGHGAVLDTRGALAVTRGRDDHTVHVDLLGDVVDTGDVHAGGLRGGGELEDALVQDTGRVVKARVLVRGAAAAREARRDGQRDGLAGANGHGDDGLVLDVEHGGEVPAKDGRVLIRIVGEGELGLAAAVADPDLAVGRLCVQAFLAPDGLEDVGLAASTGAWCGWLGGSRGAGLGLVLDGGLGRLSGGGGRRLHLGSSGHIGRSRRGSGCRLAVLGGEDGVPLGLRDVRGLDGGIVVDGVANDLGPVDGLGAGGVPAKGSVHEGSTLDADRLTRCGERGCWRDGG